MLCSMRHINAPCDTSQWAIVIPHNGPWACARPGNKLTGWEQQDSIKNVSAENVKMLYFYLFYLPTKQILSVIAYATVFNLF